MRLFIAEKPEIAKALVAGFGHEFQKKQGYYDDGKNCITWCFGHMLQLFDPEDYDPKYKEWCFSNMPFAFFPVKKKPNPKTEKQLNIIKSLIDRAGSIVNAGDPDDEGQLLVDEVLRYYDCKLPVERIIINDINAEVVKKSLANIEPNAKYEASGLRAEARSIADQYFGYNLTRAYTIFGRTQGLDGVLSVGRVQSVILGLIARRTAANKAHKKAFFYKVVLEVQGGIKCEYQAQEGDPLDDKQRIISESFCAELVKQLNKPADDKPVTASIVSFNTKDKTENAPLPYNLLKLQQDASKVFGYKPDETMAVTQSLREKHQLITYNRSDCQYLNEEHHLEAPQVSSAILQNCSELQAYQEKLSLEQKSRAFNSSKVSAHHAIIPTQTVANMEQLTDQERNIYGLIARLYLMQFLPGAKHSEAELILESCGKKFKAKGRKRLVDGWLKLSSQKPSTDSPLFDFDWSVGDKAAYKAMLTKHETQPPKLYTFATLLNDLPRVAKYVKDAKLAALLKEKDADKEGESGGIGTPATRDSIIETLFERGYVVENKKSIVSTPLGDKLYAVLSDVVKYPDMTAIWYEQQKTIKSEEDVYTFVKLMMKQVVTPELQRIKEGSPALNKPRYACPDCGRALRRLPSNRKPGIYFYGCSGFNDKENPCKSSFPELNGKPVLT